MSDEEIITHIWNIKQNKKTQTNEQTTITTTKKILIELDNRLVVTRGEGEWREGERSKGGSRNDIFVGGKCILYRCQIIMWHTQNLYNVINQCHLNLKNK